MLYSHMTCWGLAEKLDVSDCILPASVNDEPLKCISHSSLRTMKKHEHHKILYSKKNRGLLMFDCFLRNSIQGKRKTVWRSQNMTEFWLTILAVTHPLGLQEALWPSILNRTSIIFKWRIKQWMMTDEECRTDTDNTCI